MRWQQLLNRLGLVIGALLFAYQLWISFGSLSGNLSIGASWVLAASLATFLHLMQVGIWSHLVMRGVGVNFSFKLILNGFLLSGLVRYVPGGFWGYLSRSQWLFVRFAIPYEIANTGSVIQILGWVVSAGLVVVSYQALVIPDVRRVIFLALMVLVLLGMWLVLSGIAGWKRLGGLSSKGVIDLAQLRLPLWRWLVIVIAYSILWIGWGGVMILAAGDTGSLFWRNIPGVAFAYAAAWLIGFTIVFVPAGLGIREFALSSLLMAQIGISLEHASAIAVAMRFLTLLAELFALIVGAIWSPPTLARN